MSKIVIEVNPMKLDFWSRDTSTVNQPKMLDQPVVFGDDERD